MSVLRQKFSMYVNKNKNTKILNFSPKLRVNLFRVPFKCLLHFCKAVLKCANTILKK